MKVLPLIIQRSILAFMMGLIAMHLTSHKLQAQTGDDPVPIQSPDAELEARAKSIAEAMKSQTMIDLTKAMGARVRGVLGVAGEEAGDKAENSNLGSHNSVRAILFASSSMPIGTLRAYAAQLEKASGVIVFRGMPGGMSALKPMVELTKQIILRDPKCNRDDCEVFDVGVIVDPMLFRANDVQLVPALTLIDHDPFEAYCERPGMDTASVTSSRITFGDAHLTGHLEALTLLGDGRARSLLRTFRKEANP